MRLRIGQSEVGPGHPAYVVAEAGVNHNGDLDRALRLVEVAEQVGATAVKFQVFTPGELAVKGAATAQYQRSSSGRNQLDMLKRLALEPEQFQAIREHSQRVGIDFLATPFSVADLEALLALRPAAIKLASTDLDNPQLLQPAAQSGLPVILSTGAATEAEIERAVACVGRAGALDRAVLLHCVSCYPTADADANLRRIDALAKRFGLPVGYSDHTLSEQAGALAVAAGACVVEKHLTLDRSFSGPDHHASFDPDQMVRYVEAIRRAECLAGDGAIDYSPCEADVRDKSRRSVVVRRDVPAGEELSADVLTAKRPGGGLEPWHLDALVGRRTLVPIPADGQVAWEMLT